jgi:hypothetical protein
MGKNIEKVKKLIAGVGGQGGIRVGYTPKSVSMRKEGEEWTDARGRSWKIEDGKRKQIPKVPPRGFDKCNDCEKLIFKIITFIKSSWWYFRNLFSFTIFFNPSSVIMVNPSFTFFSFIYGFTLIANLYGAIVNTLYHVFYFFYITHQLIPRS